MNLEIKLWAGISSLLTVLVVCLFVQNHQEKKEEEARQTRLFFEMIEKRKKEDIAEREAAIKENLAHAEELANQMRKP